LPLVAILAVIAAGSITSSDPTNGASLASARVSNAIGANPPPIPFDVNVRKIDDETGTVLVSVRGLNMLPSYVPVFLCGDHATPPAVNTRVVGSGLTTTYPERGSTSTNDDHVSGRFTWTRLPVSTDQTDWDTFDVDILDVPVAIVDTETGTFVHVPDVIPPCWSPKAGINPPKDEVDDHVPAGEPGTPAEPGGDDGQADATEVVDGGADAHVDEGDVIDDAATDEQNSVDEPAHESVPAEEAELAPGDDVLEHVGALHATTLESAQEPVTAGAASAPRARTPRARRTSPQQP